MKMYKQLLHSNNFIEFLDNNTDLSRIKKIQIGYDLQCGKYEANFKSLNSPGFFTNLTKKRLAILKEKIYANLKYKKFCNILEVGIGEGNTMRHLINDLDESILDKINFYGVELSFCRIQTTKKHLPNCNLMVADMTKLPFENDSFDIVYTASAIEPNINNEKNILNELHRVSKKDLILFEISYREASASLKKRFDNHKYIKKLYETILNENYNLVSYKELETRTTYNNYVYLIEKKLYSSNFTEKDIKYVSPVFNDELDQVSYDNSNYYKSKKLNLYFPIVDTIGILLIDNAISINDTTLHKGRRASA